MKLKTQMNLYFTGLVLYRFSEAHVGHSSKAECGITKEQRAHGSVDICGYVNVGGWIFEWLGVSHWQTISRTLAFDSVQDRGPAIDRWMSESGAACSGGHIRYVELVAVDRDVEWNNAWQTVSIVLSSVFLPFLNLTADCTFPFQCGLPWTFVYNVFETW